MDGFSHGHGGANARASAQAAIDRLGVRRGPSGADVGNVDVLEPVTGRGGPVLRLPVSAAGMITLID